MSGRLPSHNPAGPGGRAGQGPGPPFIPTARGARHERAPAVLPTVTVLAVLGLTEALNGQRLFFASLAAGAFLIYLDPGHPAQRHRRPLGNPGGGRIGRFRGAGQLGPGYGSAAVERGVGILSMVARQAVHPLAVSTALSFALAKSSLSDLLRLVVGVGVAGTLAVLQRRALAWLVRPSPNPERTPV